MFLHCVSVIPWISIQFLREYCSWRLSWFSRFSIDTSLFRSLIILSFFRLLFHNYRTCLVLVNSLNLLSPWICFSLFSWASKNNAFTCFSMFCIQLTNILTQPSDFKLSSNTGSGDVGVLVLLWLSSRDL